MGEIIVSGTRVNPNMYVAGVKSTGQLLSRHRGGPWRLHIHSPQRQSDWYFGQGLRSAVRGWGVCFFPVRFLRLREKIFRRSRHLTDSI